MRFPSLRDPTVGSRLAMILAFTSALFVVALDASAQIDLTGRWRVEEGTPDVFADIVQSGTSVSVAWTLGPPLVPGPWPLNLNGTFDQTTLVATDGTAWSITMQAYGPGDVLDGTFLALFNPLAGHGHIYFTRCECYDGNEIDGDGCSSVCRVEPCFSCTAEPSVCTPSPDTATCDDGNDCTIGETCSAGVCGAGSPVSPCVNLDGVWSVSSQLPDFGTEGVADRRFLQRKGVVTEVDVSQGVGDFPSSVGTVDTETGEMSLISSGGRVYCTTSSTFAGTASLDNLTFSGSGVVTVDRPGSCFGFTVNQQGVRLPSASVPTLSGWGWIAVTLILLALGLLWQTANTARPRS